MIWSLSSSMSNREQQNKNVEGSPYRTSPPRGSPSAAGQDTTYGSHGRNRRRAATRRRPSPCCTSCTRPSSAERRAATHFGNVCRVSGTMWGGRQYPGMVHASAAHAGSPCSRALLLASPQAISGYLHVVTRVAEPHVVLVVRVGDRTDLVIPVRAADVHLASNHAVGSRAPH